MLKVNGALTKTKLFTLYTLCISVTYRFHLNKELL